MSIEPVAGPSCEPVSLDEAKAYLRVDHDDEDAFIARLVVAARDIAERHTGRVFIARSFTLWRDAWPSGALEIPKPPLIAVTEVTAYGRSGAATTLSSDAYIVDSAAAPGRIVLKAGTVPPADLREAKAIAVSFDAGYGEDPADVPAAIRAAILSIIARLYESRGEDAALPQDALALLAPYRILAL